MPAGINPTARDILSRIPTATSSTPIPSMDKDHKPHPSNEKPAEKKPSQQGGNLVWYMLGLGVLLLLMVTIFNSGSGVTLGFSDLLQLIEVSGDGETSKDEK